MNTSQTAWWEDGTRRRLDKPEDSSSREFGGSHRDLPSAKFGRLPLFIYCRFANWRIYICLVASSTYEAAEKFLVESMGNDGFSSAEEKSIQPLEIASLLGWASIPALIESESMTNSRSSVPDRLTRATRFALHRSLPSGGFPLTWDFRC